MEVNKAVFGQVGHGHGHGLRDSSSNADFFKKASQWLDLPDSLPSGVKFSPYISGFALKNYYVIAKTFLDKDASRSGMVVSYALAVCIDEIRDLSNLNQLLNLLPDTLVNDNEFCNKCTIIHPTSDLTESTAFLSHDAVELLVSKKDGPVIHIGFLGFNELVASIWQKLWPSMRSNFSFRLSLSPRDCIEPTSPNLVCIPESLISRWNGDYKIIGKAPRSNSLSVVAKVFLTGYEEYNDFCINFGIELMKPSTLEFVVQAYNLYSKNILQPEFDNCLFLMRLIEQLSPNSIKGSAKKEQLVLQLKSLIPEIDPSEILKLRNISGQGFKTLKVLWDTLELKLKNCQFYKQDDSSILKIISDSFDEEKATESWRQSVQAGFIQTFTNEGSSVYPAVWRWLNNDFKVTERLLNHIEITSSIEDLLIKNAPNEISGTTAEFMLLFCTNNDLLHLHGLVLALRYSTYDAFLRQLQIDKNRSSMKGLEVIANKSEPSELLHACLSINDELITKIIVTNAVKNPLILREISFGSSKSLSIWAKVLAINPSVWDAPEKSQEILFSLLDEFVTLGKSNNIELLCLLSTTPISDLCEFPKRSMIWNLLDRNVRENYMSQTALGWYKRALDHNFVELDDELDEAVSQVPDLVERIHQFDSASTKVTLEIFKRVKSLPESYFLIWLDLWIDNTNYQHDSNALAIGQLIQFKKWRDSASLLYRRYNSSPSNIDVVLRYCKGLLPWWDMFNISSFRANDKCKWQALEELVQELYPSGPIESDIWARSGGSNGSILNNRAGSETWRYAIQSIRNGAKPFANNLIYNIKVDFPNNNKVAILEKLFED